MTMDVYAQLEQRAKRSHGTSFDRLVTEAREQVPHLPFPHSSQVDGELRELRCHFGSDHYRVLYRRSERLIVLLHVFAKNDWQAAGGRDRGGPAGVAGLQGPHGCGATGAAEGGGP